jgi:phosphate transport system protein
MASEHTVKAFDSDLQELTRLVAEMGGLAERMITDSVDALVRRDIVLGQRVVATDLELDNLQRVIEERAVLTIAKRQPMAVDLRVIVGWRPISSGSAISPRTLPSACRRWRAISIP